MRSDAADAIADLVEEHAPNQAATVAAGGIDVLIEVLRAGIVADAALSVPTEVEAVADAAHALANLAAGSHATQASLVAAGGVPLLVTAFGSTSGAGNGAMVAIGNDAPSDLATHAGLALRNLARGGAAFRATVLAAGGARALLGIDCD